MGSFFLPLLSGGRVWARTASCVQSSASFSCGPCELEANRSVVSTAGGPNSWIKRVCISRRISRCEAHVPAALLMLGCVEWGTSSRIPGTGTVPLRPLQVGCSTLAMQRTCSYVPRLRFLLVCAVPLPHVAHRGCCFAAAHLCTGPHLTPADHRLRRQRALRFIR